MKKRTKLKRLLSILLVLIMVLTPLSTTTLAEEPPTTTPEATVIDEAAEKPAEGVDDADAPDSSDEGGIMLLGGETTEAATAPAAAVTGEEAAKPGEDTDDEAAPDGSGEDGSPLLSGEGTAEAAKAPAAAVTGEEAAKPGEDTGDEAAPDGSGEDGSPLLSGEGTAEAATAPAAAVTGEEAAKPGEDTGDEAALDGSGEDGSPLSSGEGTAEAAKAPAADKGTDDEAAPDDSDEDGTMLLDGGTTEYITKIEITNVPTPVAGQACSTDGITITTDPADAADVKDFYWWDEAYDTDMSLPDTFVEGHEYFLRVSFEPKDGYAFEFDADDNCICTVTVDNDNVEMEDGYDAGDDGIVFMSKLVKAMADSETTIPTKITSVTVTNVPTPVADQACSTNGITITTDPAGAADERASYWWDATDLKRMSSTDTFVEGHEYHLAVEILPKTGYAFEFDSSSTALFKPYTGTVTFDSVAVDKAEQISSSSTNIGLFIRSKPVKAMADSGTTTPLSFADNSAYDVPEGTKDTPYTAETAFTAIGGTEPYTFTVDPAVDGLSINSENKLVYTRPTVQKATTATIKVTDAKNDNKTISIDIGDVSEATTPITITKIEITNVPTPVAGQSCSTEGITITTDPADAADVKDFYWWDKAYSKFMSSTDKFVEEHVYRLLVSFEPKDGYAFEFDSDKHFICTVTFDDVEPNEYGTYGDKGIAFISKPVTAMADSGTTTTYTVTFDANGGSGSMAAVTGVSGSYTLPVNGFTEPVGKQFKGWATTVTDTVISEKTIIVSADTTLYAIWEDDPAATGYKFTVGDGGIYIKGSEQTLEFTTNGPKDDCTGIKIDGSLIGAGNYTLESGSTIITLENAYLETLSEGEHDIAAVYGKQEATAKFKVLADDPMYATVVVPISKTVEQVGNVAPEAATFTYEIYGNRDDVNVSGLTITGNTISTNGAGTYTGEITISGHIDNFDSADGLKLTEKNDGAENWLYDSSTYIIQRDTGNGQLIQKDMGDGANPETVDTAAFTNKYTKQTTDTTIEIPIYKTVVQGGTVAPEARTFEFVVTPYGNPEADLSSLSISGTSIETNGTNNYIGTIRISGDLDVAKNARGLRITEKNDGAANWSYDTAAYIVYPDTGNGMLIQKDMGTDINQTEVRIVSFTNTYTKIENQILPPANQNNNGSTEANTETDAEEDTEEETEKETEAKTNGNKKGNTSGNINSSSNGNTGGSGLTASPKTGDNSHILLWIAVLFVSFGGIVTTFFVRKKRGRIK